MSVPFKGSGRLREGGFAATHLQDFKAHAQGNGWRHTSDQTDMNPAISIDNGIFNAATVQATLEKITTFLNTTGQGFITIGDGYDTQHADFVVGSGEDVSSAFNDAFIHPRLANGGVILVKAGTYRLKTTVTVPSGFVIMGEMGGTILQGEVIEQPMFIMNSATDRPQISSDGILAKYPLDKSQFFNIVLADNLDGYVNSGAACMTTVPMIRCQTGSYVICTHTAFLGKMGTLGAGPGFGRTKTLYAAGFTNTTANESTLIFENCTFDGFTSIVKYDPANINDKLIINGCNGRAFGTEALADSTNATKNCFVLITGTMTVSIKGNNLIGTDGNSYIFALVTFTAGTPIISIANNTGTIRVPSVFEQLVNNNGSGIWEESTNNNLFNNKSDLTISAGNNAVGIQSNNSGLIVLNGSTGQLLLGANSAVISSSNNITVSAGDDISITSNDFFFIRSDNIMSVSSENSLLLSSDTDLAQIYGSGISITAGVNDVDIQSTSGDISIAAPAGDISVSSQVILSSAGRIKYRVTYGTNTNSTYLITTTDILIARHTTITAARNYTISNTGAALGSIIECINLSMTYSITLLTPDAVTIIVLETAIPANLNYAKLCYFDADDGDGLQWHVLNLSL